MLCRVVTDTADHHDDSNFEAAIEAHVKRWFGYSVEDGKL